MIVRFRSGFFLDLLNLAGPTKVELGERYPRHEASTARFGGLGQCCCMKRYIYKPDKKFDFDMHRQ
jgi:hypothetical protein